MTVRGLLVLIALLPGCGTTGKSLLNPDLSPTEPATGPSQALGLRFAATETLGVEYERGRGHGPGSDMTSWFVLGGYKSNSDPDTQSEHIQFGGGVRLYRRHALEGTYIALAASRMDISFSGKNGDRDSGYTPGFSVTIGYRGSLGYIEAGVSLWDPPDLHSGGHAYADAEQALERVMPALNLGLQFRW
jgi:hypothetical protein